MKLHTHHELKSLQMHSIVAERFHEDPEYVIRFGLNNLQKWKRNGVHCDDFDIWETILRKQPSRLVDVLCSDDEESIRLRQSSPFAGLIPEELRMQILSRVG